MPTVARCRRRITIMNGSEKYGGTIGPIGLGYFGYRVEPGFWDKGLG